MYPAKVMIKSLDSNRLFRLHIAIFAYFECAEMSLNQVTFSIFTKPNHLEFSAVCEPGYRHLLTVDCAASSRFDVFGHVDSEGKKAQFMLLLLDKLGEIDESLCNLIGREMMISSLASLLTSHEYLIVTIIGLLEEKEVTV
ncbi:hypothetical protein [Motilimonas eburnea]|uniref:hypothetical protein n=1 Tax=Motilimonas eburnea TaxID=1737488 RepID=UPI001E2F4A78|nr:hypothetical protein [Motilimonas eburnea]MCE2571787.1 hypothetical protein [Motilimonas eburnea]